jgi:hypothetical protein
VSIFKKKKKALIGILMAALLVVAGSGIYKANAAARVDTSETITIVAGISDTDTSVFATKYKGTVKIKLYKIADMDETGKLNIVEGFKDAGIDLSVLETNPTAETIQSSIVNPAKAVAPENTDLVITLDRSAGAQVEPINIPAGAGLYLYVPEDITDARYKYTFISYVVMAPTSELITTGTGSDAWVNTVRFNLKATEQERFGNLEIKKKLDSFNVSLGTASFVYRVTIKDGNETVSENVYSLDFDSATTKTKLLENIPAGYTVIVKEEYTGASYSLVGDATATKTIEGEKTVTAEFENTYDNRLITGGVSAENNFENEDGTIYWVKPDKTKVKQ